MSDRCHWSRRSFLAGVGAAALAGCTTATDGRGTDSGASSPTPTPASSTPPESAPGTAARPTTETETATPPDGGETTTRGPVPEPPETFETAWPVPPADAGLTNHAAGAPGPTERPTELWRLASNTTFSTPVLAGRTVFVGASDGSVRALDARTGEERWQQSVGESAGAPWAVGDRLYVPTGSALVALAQSDGSESWRVETPDRAAVLVASHSVYWLDGREPAVVALAREDGSERWRTPIADPWDPPVFASDTSVFVSSGTHDVRFWTLAVDSGEVTSEKPRWGNDFPAEQFYVDGTVYAVDAFFGNVRASPVANGGDGWSQGVSTGGSDGGGLLSGGRERVYYTANVEDKPGLYALSRTDGTVAWTVDVAATITGRPVVADEAALVPTDDGVYCFATADGTERWTRADLGRRLVVVDDLVYAAGDGMVRALRPP